MRRHIKPIIFVEDKMYTSTNFDKESVRIALINHFNDKVLVVFESDDSTEEVKQLAIVHIFHLFDGKETTMDYNQELVLYLKHLYDLPVFAYNIRVLPNKVQFFVMWPHHNTVNGKEISNFVLEDKSQEVYSLVTSCYEYYNSKFKDVKNINYKRITEYFKNLSK